MLQLTIGEESGIRIRDLFKTGYHALVDPFLREIAYKVLEFSARLTKKGGYVAYRGLVSHFL